MIRLEKIDGGYKVFYENGVDLGEFLSLEDGFYGYWPRNGGGFWSAEIMHVLADKMDELNQPWKDEIDRFFSKST